MKRDNVFQTGNTVRRVSKRAFLKRYVDDDVSMQSFGASSMYPLPSKQLSFDHNQIGTNSTTDSDEKAGKRKQNQIYFDDNHKLFWISLRSRNKYDLECMAKAKSIPRVLKTKQLVVSDSLANISVTL
jgi:hypothetical protein